MRRTQLPRRVIAVWDACYHFTYSQIPKEPLNFRRIYKSPYFEPVMLVSKCSRLSDEIRNHTPPLHHAAKSGNTDLLCDAFLHLFQEEDQRLLDTFHAGKTPLLFAIESGCPITVRLLLEAGADPNVASKKEHTTPLHFAIQRSFNLDIIRELLFHGADPGLSVGGTLSARDYASSMPAKDTEWGYVRDLLLCPAAGAQA
jgi:ankyrin repeat protein